MKVRNPVRTLAVAIILTIGLAMSLLQASSAGAIRGDRATPTEHFTFAGPRRR